MPELNEINDSLADFEEELSKLKSASGMIEDAQRSAQTTISESKIITEKIIEQSKKSSDGAIQESKKLNESANELLEAVDELLEKFDKVDFPIRLDKLDTSVSGINNAIQNLFSRIESIERNLKDDFNSKISTVQDKIEKSQKANVAFLILILLVTAGSLIALLLIN
jgi:chromosome segregation ATPase